MTADSVDIWSFILIISGQFLTISMDGDHRQRTSVSTGLFTNLHDVDDEHESMVSRGISKKTIKDRR